VTLAVWIRGKCPTKDVLPYMISQVIGAVVAAVVVGFLYGAGKPMVITAVPQAISPSSSLPSRSLRRAECRDGQGTENNSFYGLAIGFTVLTGRFRRRRDLGRRVQPGGRHRRRDDETHHAVADLDSPPVRLPRRRRRRRRFLVANRPAQVVPTSGWQDG
jgi:hypothetical protein